MARLKYKSLFFVFLTPFLHFLYFFREDCLERLLALFILILFSFVFENFSFFVGLFNDFLKLIVKKKKIFFIGFFCLNFIFILLFAKRFPYLGGDEPHYLIIAQSLVEDGDIDLYDNYKKRSYDIFHPVKLSPHTHFGRKEKGWYPFHSPALSVFLIPSYLLIKALAYRNYFLSTFILRSYVSIFGLAFIFIFFKLYSKEKPHALFVLLPIFYFSSPIFFYSIHLYPELFALLISFSAYLLLEKEKILLSGILISVLIFFHTKFLIVELGFILFYLTYKKSRKIWLFALPSFFTFILHSIYLKLIYGSFSPTLVYEGIDSKKWIRIIFSIPFNVRVESFFDYFLDQRDGLLLYAPYFFLLFLSFNILKRNRKLLLLFLTIFLPYSLYYAFLTSRGAYSPPARPLVPVLWIVFIILYEFFKENRANKKLFYLLGTISLGIFLILLFNPLFLYQPTTSGVKERASALFIYLSNMNIYFPNYLPSFIKGAANNLFYLPNIIWIFGIMAGALLFYYLKKKELFVNIIFYVVVLFFLISRVLFPYPQAKNPLKLRRVKGIVFYNLSKDLRLLYNGKGFFIVHNREKGFKLLFSSYSKLKKISLKIGGATNIFDTYVFFGDKKFLFRSISEKILIVNSPKVYKKGDKYYYYLKIKLKSRKDLRTFPFVIIFDSVSF